MFQPPVVAIFREVFCEGYITQKTKTIYNYKMLFLSKGFKIYVKIQNIDIGNNRWSKHVGGYAVYITINLHI